MRALNNHYLMRNRLLTINSTMKNSFFIFLLGIFTVFSAFAQQTSIKGSVKDALTGEYLPDVTITIEDTSQAQQLMLQGSLVLLKMYL